MPSQQLPCSSAAGVARPPVCAAPARPTRQCTASAAQQRRQRQQQHLAWQQQRQGPGALQAAHARPVMAAGRDAGDDFEEMLGRRDELLRIRDDLEDGLNTDEDEELADLTERLLKFGYLEDTESLDDLANSDDEDDEEEDEEDDDEEAAALLDDEEEADVAASDEEAAPRRNRGRGTSAVPAVAELAIDDIVSEAQRGGIAEIRNMGVFEASSPGVTPEGADAAAPAAESKFPQPPQRSYRLADLLRAAGYEEQSESAPDIEVRGLLTCNSLAAAPQSLFVCVDSDDGAWDGHDWADEASEQGAVAVIAERPLPDALLPVVVVDSVDAALGRLADAFYERPSRRLRTVGFVGAYGKTTSAWLARGMFEEAGERCGMIGTIEYALEEVRLTEEGEVWVPDQEDVTLQRDCSSPFHITPYEGKYPEVSTTPDALKMHQVLAGCADRGAGVGLVEVQPWALGDGRADAVDFDVLVFTNSCPEKEEAVLGVPEGSLLCREAAAQLFRRIQQDPERQRAVINTDDRIGAELAREALAANATVITYSVDDKSADIFAEKVKTSIWETEVLVNTPLGRLQIITPLVGRTNVYNILAAVGTGIACGVPLKSIVAGIEAVDIVPGRCEIIDEGQAFSVVVDSASTPWQLSRLVDEIKEAGARRVLLVFGCPEATTAFERAELTKVAHYKSDWIFITNDSPGRQWPSDIISDMVAGLPTDVQNKHASSAYNYLQDPHRVPPWFQKFMLQYQSAVGVHIIEDRFQAIRVAIGMAKARDVVVVAGKGHIDYQEYWDGADWHERETVKSWFDDRVECRNALSKLPYLNGIKDLNRNALPWTRYPEEREFLDFEGVQDSATGDVA